MSGGDRALVLLGGQTSIDAEGPVAERIRRLLRAGAAPGGGQSGPRREAARVLDPLTSLANRGEFERVLEVYRRDGKDHAPPATLVYVDLDFFKRLNDTLGHAAGDAALRQRGARARDRRPRSRSGRAHRRRRVRDLAPGDTARTRVGGRERIRASVARTAWQWSGAQQRSRRRAGSPRIRSRFAICSISAAAADAALYRPSRGGGIGLKRRAQVTNLHAARFLGATGFDGFGEGTVACPGSQSPGKSTGLYTSQF